MREALRGALLSVLFFGLMIGGGPGMVTAEKLEERHGPCQTPGHINTSGGCMSPEAFKQHNACDDAADNLAYMGIFGGAGFIASIIPEPFTSAAGIGAMIWGGVHGIMGGLGWVINDC